MNHLATAPALAPIGHPAAAAPQRPMVPKPICKCCGGPRSQFSAGWCKTCYSKKSRPASFDKDALRSFDIERYEVWSAYLAARDVVAEHQEKVRAERAMLRATAAEKKAEVIARRAEYAAEQARATAEWRAKKLAEIAANKKAKQAAAYRSRALSPARLVYPFASAARPVSCDLLLVNSVVPRGIEGREDICQEIMIALWEKSITIDDIKSNRANLRAFVTAFRKANFEGGGYAVSLDQPMRDGRSWHDVLVDTRELEGEPA